MNNKLLQQQPGGGRRGKGGASCCCLFRRLICIANITANFKISCSLCLYLYLWWFLPSWSLEALCTRRRCRCRRAHTLRLRWWILQSGPVRICAPIRCRTLWPLCESLCDTLLEKLPSTSLTRRISDLSVFSLYHRYPSPPLYTRCSTACERHSAADAADTDTGCPVR